MEWKWLLLPDPADYHLPKASPNALPMPTTRKAQQELNAKKRPEDELPRKDDLFVEGGFTWAEFNPCETIRNSAQVKIDMSKDSQVWHYLGKNSTETKPQYTEDPARRVHNTKSNFLETVPKAVVRQPPRPVAPPRQSFAASYPRQAMPPPAGPLVPPGPKQLPSVPQSVVPVPKQESAAPKPQDKPYLYKPRKPSVSRPAAQNTPQKFAPKTAPPISPVNQQLVANQQRAASQQHLTGKGLSFGSDPRFKGSATFRSWDHFAPLGGTNGYPELPGLTWPPAHMKSGQYSQPQTRVWPNSTATAGTRPERIPMTSSELNPSSPTIPKAGGGASQKAVAAYQKYSFFQVNHNR